jgi:hypothetical protein
VGRCSASPGAAAASPTAAAPAPQGEAPCDIYASGGSPCVAAHSTVRALFEAYTGPLYSVVRARDNATKLIAPLQAGGYADAAAQVRTAEHAPSPLMTPLTKRGGGSFFCVQPGQCHPGTGRACQCPCGHSQPLSCPPTIPCVAQDAFCAGTGCTVETIFDQSPHANHLAIYGTCTSGEPNRERGQFPWFCWLIYTHTNPSPSHGGCIVRRADVQTPSNWPPLVAY